MSEKTKRILMSVGGVLIGGISVGFMKIAAAGVDPFQSMMSGLDALVPISFGTLYVLANLALLSFSLLTDRHNIGIATFVNLFLLGYVVDFTAAALRAALPEPGAAVRCACLLFGITVLCAASSLYMTADLGVSTYDAVAIVLSGKWKLAQFQYCRIATDLVCVILGAALYLLSGGAVSGIFSFIGVGTIVTAFFMGPLIALFNRHLAQPLLNR